MIVVPGEPMPRLGVEQKVARHEFKHQARHRPYVGVGAVLGAQNHLQIFGIVRVGDKKVITVVIERTPDVAKPPVSLSAMLPMSTATGPTGPAAD